MGQAGTGRLQNVRLTVLLLAVLNVATLPIAALVAYGASRAECPRNLAFAAQFMAWGAAMRLIWMLGMAFAQTVIASTMVAEDESSADSRTLDSTLARHRRRRWYTRWLWWSRVGNILTVLQVFGVSYFAWFLGRSVSISDRHVMFCPRGEVHIDQKWLMALMLNLPTLGGIIVLAQCCIGSDVLAWRLLYGTHYEAWRSHYRQMFDYGIRELLCCLGRGRYMSVREEDEVDSVATLLGDLVAYRAAGASHLEVIAGVALLRKENSKNYPEQEFQPAPHAVIAECSVLHPYAVAAYTGPLLDIGRNPLTFPCAWLYRQGILTPWTRNRRPALQGDNWWRGHAAAFLGFAGLPPEALCQGRVLQTNRESVYFVVILHQLRYVLVAVRGTETPEDLLTDGLGRESTLTNSDLCGILKNSMIPDRVKQEILDSMPHFGHVGVIEAARELAMQLDYFTETEETAEHAPTDDGSNSNYSAARGCLASLPYPKRGLLSSLLGPGGECEGYSLRLVGHSLGGSIAALTGLRLASRYPNLHVYTFGVLPCVDLVTAEACSTFTTSIIYNDEFSSRLSIAAILRLRAAALQALAADSNTDADLVTKLARRLFKSTSEVNLEAGTSTEAVQGRHRRYSSALKGGAFLCSLACRCMVEMPKHNSRHFTGVQISAFGQDHEQDFASESLQELWTEKCEITATESSRDILDASGKPGDEFYQPLSNHKTAFGVSCADGEAVGIDTGTEIYGKEEAVALMKATETDRQGQERQDDEGFSASFELSDNGMLKDMSGLGSSSNAQELWPAEMFVPGVVVHIIRTAGPSKWFPLWRALDFFGHRKYQDKPKHIAVLKDRKHFRDIVVSPAMFLDHVPWKCQYALDDVLGHLNTADLNQARNTMDSVTSV